MSRWYLDTSSALKLILAEAESAALIERINAERPTLTGCWLLDTELRRAVSRNPLITHERVSSLLDTIELHEMPAPLFRAAGLLPGVNLRSLDALHLTAAIWIRVDLVVTYDKQMTAAARSLGVKVLAPT